MSDNADSNNPQQGHQTPPPFAIALGGLAGNNAHGAGCLQALLDSGHEPSLISCTSGQIYWVYLYLEALKAKKAKNGDKKNPFADCERADIEKGAYISCVFQRQQDELKPAYNTMMALFNSILENPETQAIMEDLGDLLEKTVRFLLGAVGDLTPSDIKDKIEKQLKDKIEKPFRKGAREVAESHARYFDRLLKSYQSHYIGKIQNIFAHELDYAVASILWWGVPHRYRFPWVYWSYDLLDNVVSAWLRLISSSDRSVYAWKEFTNVLPGRLLVPQLFEEPGDSHRLQPRKGAEQDSGSLQQRISDALNDSRISVIFNSFDLRHGIEYVHINEPAMKSLDIKQEVLGHRTKTADKPQYRDRVIYESITPEAVKSALWLYHYGLDAMTTARVDGAYYRQIILSDLVRGLREWASKRAQKTTSSEESCRNKNSGTPKVFVIRPVNYEWIGDYPKTYNDIRDLETKVSFGGAYAGERDRVLLMNKLIDETREVCKRGGGCHICKKYHTIDLIEFEPEVQRGFYEYIFEDPEVFKRSKTQFAEKLGRNGYEPMQGLAECSGQTSSQ